MGYCLDVILELEAETLSELILFNARPDWVSGADFIEMGEFLAEEGSNFGKNGKMFGRILGRRQSEAHFNLTHVKMKWEMKLR